ncbi:hypothetical protein BSU04_01650 [Caballeronia sordidicola]|uniref:Uncharacterized protein n=1 Tax=Caballeronia sordidicola TaxID=196367 RepID=A0A226XAE9_CABSO|nr:hypothetical protein BSU04_01650 [Caballeronia sordidicola]
MLYSPDPSQCARSRLHGSAPSSEHDSLCSGSYAVWLVSMA